MKRFLSSLLIALLLAGAAPIIVPQLSSPVVAAQHDFDISAADANTGITFRAAVNSALQSLATCSSGSTAPTTPYAYQLWADTSTGLMKQRNAGNTAWTTLFNLNTSILDLLAEKAPLVSPTFTETLTAGETNITGNISAESTGGSSSGTINMNDTVVSLSVNQSAAPYNNSTLAIADTYSFLKYENNSITNNSTYLETSNGQIRVLTPSIKITKYDGTLHDAPANSSSACTTGDLRFGSGYIYFCTATNTWKRAALSTW